MCAFLISHYIGVKAETQKKRRIYGNRQITRRTVRIKAGYYFISVVLNDSVQCGDDGPHWTYTPDTTKLIV